MSCPYCAQVSKSYAHAMIAGLLPYLLWHFTDDADSQKCSIISSWFKPMACLWVEDTFWDPDKECVRNTSDHMLTSTLDSNDTLYWEVDKTPPTSPKRKWAQVDEETLDNSVLTIKMAPSTKSDQISIEIIPFGGGLPPAPHKGQQTHTPSPCKPPLCPNSLNRFWKLKHPIKPCWNTLTSWPHKWWSSLTTPWPLCPLTCTLPGPWIQQYAMTSSCSAQMGEVHPQAQSAQLAEPPTQFSFPSSDGEASSQGHNNEWGNMLGKNTPTQCVSFFKITMGSCRCLKGI